ncbi:hypothetical protein ABN702_18130 [Bacillus haimaensis]|uniref:hypothetical protein n=1 Tax=Bacillaceae TaxID=186817 RepID=UPI0036AFF894
MKLSDKKKSVQSLYREKVKAKEKKSQLEIMVISIIIIIALGLGIFYGIGPFVKKDDPVIYKVE